MFSRLTYLIYSLHTLKKTSLCLFFIIFFCISSVIAQPANDNCSNASAISISNSGFGLGTFKSSTDNITAATVQAGETFAQTIFQNGLDQKSIWYKFTLPTKRMVSVTLLAEPGSVIQAGDAGFAIYKTNNCLPGKSQVYDKFTPIEKFGTSAFPCVDSGVYLIQVSSKINVNGKVYVQLYLSDSTGGTVAQPQYASYDRGKDAYDFGVLTPFTSHVDFEVSCQTIESASEVCSNLFNYTQYTKSTWHTFTTPAYFDYLSVLLNVLDANNNCNIYNGAIGYRLYKGDAKTTSIASLIPVGNCDSFTNKQYYSDYKLYRCNQLDVNTTYSIQLLYKYDFEEKIHLAINYEGTKPTQAPQPVLSQIPAGNQLGILAEGDTYGEDYFGCNSRHSLHPCGFALPDKGVVKDGINYNLSTFYTFKLSSSGNVHISAIVPAPYYLNLIRLYKQAPDNNCATLDSANMIRETYANNILFGCLEAGTYTLQVMGTDSLRTDYTYCGGTNGNGSIYLLSHLGQKLNVTINVDYINAFNIYSLNAAGDYDSINYSSGKLQPLLNTVLYTAKADTFGCANTVLPPASSGDYCAYNNSPTKAIYREFVIGDANGDNKADSGIVTLSSLYGYSNNGSYMTHILYNGDANALAIAQNKHSFGDTIAGLRPVTECMYGTTCGGNKICVIPGTYSLVSLGNQNHVGSTPYDPAVQFDIITTRHNSGAAAQDMGNIIDTIGSQSGYLESDIDYFSCKDNAVTIDGYAPPVIGGDTTTKAIYRQFYLESTSIVNICAYNSNCLIYGGVLSLFSGKASAGLNTLKKRDWGFCQSLSCSPLPPGWYTVVSYGAGPSYQNPFQNNLYSYGNAVGRYSQFSITIAPGCPGPQYNRPYKAAIDTITAKPFLFDWKLRNAGNTIYPIYDTTYSLYTEHFNCTVDTPFAAYLKPCDSKVNRVAYYVFSINSESYVQISTQGLWGEVFNKDVRKDSLLFSSLTPMQPCVKSNSQIQICGLQPGTYTLVLFADDSYVYNGCGNVTPTVYIDKPGYSRFDHANNAYDFGIIPPDSVYHSGKAGDINPLNSSWAASNDFFYCTTGSQVNDPPEAPSCYVVYDSLIYKNKINNYLFEGDNIYYYNFPRRNLWYTFVVDKPGYVHVKVNNKTSDKQSQYAFAVYKSDADGSLPFSKVASTGQVDSTLNQGLTFITHNHSGYYCYNYNEINFYNEPCSFAGPIRYYVLVENTFDMQTNSQAEVEILLDSVNAITPKFDHYYQANSIGNNLGTGIYKGATDNYSCATRDFNDPVYAYDSSSCHKTLWYKFTTNVTGHIRFRAVINGMGTYNYDYYHIQLFRQSTAGDSTSKGLQIQNLYNEFYYDPVEGAYWGQTCVSPGTYYILLPGCAQVNEYVYPEIQIAEEAGDFCSAPVIANLKGPGTKVASAIINCHTIGTDYGEFAPTLSCPGDAKTSDYKSTWYRIDISGSDTLDVTVNLQENTNAKSDEIKYRLMTGDCGAMQAQSCVEDALTVNTYRCLSPGGYYVQVFTPVLNNLSQQVTGTIDLQVSAQLHADTCIPDKNCLATARFNAAFDCTKDSVVQFVNSSTYGSSIIYKWDFGYAGKTSSDVSPAFFYPALAGDTTYKVKLVVENVSCNKKDSFSTIVSVPGRPYINFGNDLHLCDYDDSVILHATSFTGATYQWNTGSQDSVIDVSANKDQNQYSAQVIYNGCISRDTINIFINPYQKKPTQQFVVCADSIQLYDYRGTANYLWNTGTQNYFIYVKEGGTYWLDILYKNCITRDSFTVITPSVLHPLGADTTLCEAALPYKQDVTIADASSYNWQDNSTSPMYDITKEGLYWVDIVLAGCTFRDSVLIKIDSVKFNDVDAAICAGQKYTLPSGRMVDVTDVYKDTLLNIRNCDSLITTVNLTVKNPSFKIIDVSVCEGQPYMLPSGKTVTVAGMYNDTLRSIIFDCDSVITTINLSIQSLKKVTKNATICAGQNYVLPSGKPVNITGVYEDTLRSTTGGCDSLITTVNLAVQPLALVAFNINICEGQVYTLPSGKTINTTGIYKDTLRSLIFGCDSLIATVNLTVLAPVFENESLTICGGQNYVLPSGKIVSATGTYKDTLRNVVSGCDSIITTTDLTVHDVTSVTKNVIICAGQNYILPSGKQVSAAATYQDTLRWTVTGCDSLITTVNLNVQQVKTSSSIATICSGQSYTLPSGKIITSSGIYKDTLRWAITGCDSLITTTTLNVLAASLTSIDKSICLGASYLLPSGKMVNMAGAYTDTLKNTAGCDSLITITNLSVFSPVFFNTTASVCSGQAYTLPSGKTVSVAGVYKDTLHSKAGCDSLITTIDLSVFSPVLFNINAFICSGQAYTLPSGKTENIAGIYNDTLKSITGCDSVITTINLTVFASELISKSFSICSGQKYTLPSGKAVSIAGIYKDTIKNLFGCDSLLTTLTLDVVNPITVNKNVSVCAGNTYTLPSGKIVNAAGLYKDTLKSIAGCDSLITATDVSIFSSTLKNTVASICLGQLYTLPSGKTINNAGVYNDTLKSMAGCDSLITTLTLNVFTPLFMNTSATICVGQIYTLPSGRTVNTSGIFKDTLRNVSGCDSLITTLTLNVISPKLVNTNAFICPGESYALPSGTVVNTQKVYADTIRSLITGCDSLITTVNLIINNTSSSNAAVSICAGQSYILPSGQKVNVPGVYASTIKNSKGCDSVITTTVAYYSSLSVKLTGPAAICKGGQALLSAQASGGNGGPYTYTWSAAPGTNDKIMISPAADTKVIVSVSDGCTLLPAKDSITVKVNIKPIPNFSILPQDGCVPLTVKFNNLTSPLAGSTYAWNFGDKTSGTQLSPSHTYVTPGPYTVSLIATNINGCSDSFKIANGVKAFLKPLAAFKTSPFPNVIANSKIDFTDLSLGASSWLWVFGDGLGTSVQRDPTYIYNDAGNYTTMLIVATPNKCTDTAYSKIEITGGKEIYIPNAFTPDGDGINDNFRIYGIGLQSVDMAIYDRWGEKVFEQKANPPVWDGKYQKYGTLCPQGVFVYIIKAVDKNGEAHSFKGTVTLLR